MLCKNIDVCVGLISVICIQRGAEHAILDQGQALTKFSTEQDTKRGQLGHIIFLIKLWFKKKQRI